MVGQITSALQGMSANTTENPYVNPMFSVPKLIPTAAELSGVSRRILLPEPGSIKNLSGFVIDPG
jgi:hypothetical protein